MHTPSLKWRLVRRLTALQAALLTFLALLIVGVLWATGCLATFEPEDDTIEAIRSSIARDANGTLFLRETPQLAERRSETPDFWFIIRDRNASTLSEGAVPPAYARIGDVLDNVSQARFGGTIGDPAVPMARLKWIHTEAGDVQVLTGPGGTVPLRRVLFATSKLFLSTVLPLIAITALATLIATPIVVRKTLASLGDAAAQAERIDTDRRGTRLPLGNVPSEIIPLVAAVNDALGRLDDGYERQQRFVANAAHELRTPIAILQTRLDGLTNSPEKTRLLEDIARLSTLADQLLDLQRLHHRLSLSTVDLVDIGRGVMSDLAPLAIAAGYEPVFEADEEKMEVIGDRAALERAVTNLVQNAIQHGGRKGAITIHVGRATGITVTDEGEGIAMKDRARIFEPFYRLATRGRGFGLGLNLVQDIVRLHHGQVSVLDGPAGGASFRMTLPSSAG